MDAWPPPEAFRVQKAAHDSYPRDYFKVQGTSLLHRLNSGPHAWGCSHLSQCSRKRWERGRGRAEKGLTQRLLGLQDQDWLPIHILNSQPRAVPTACSPRLSRMTHLNWRLLQMRGCVGLSLATSSEPSGGLAEGPHGVIFSRSCP